MSRDRRLTISALLAWSALLLAVSARLLATAPTRNSVYPIFADAGRSWRAGEGVYLLPESTPGKTVFRYSPAVAAFFAPFTLLPDSAGNIVWRVLNVAAALAALAWWLRVQRSPQWPAVVLLVLPLAVGNVNNGQSNLLILALLLAAVTAAQADRLRLAAACCAAATLFKIYPLALGLLLVLVLPRRFLGWLALFLGLGLVLPFLCQQPGYVQGQYADWIRYLGHDDRSSWALADGYRDLRMLLATWGMTLGDRPYLLLQLWGAAACAAAVLGRQFVGCERERLLRLLLGLAVVWMTLLGPCSESSTYVLLAPTLALGLLTANGLARGWLIGSYGLLLAAGAAGWFPGGTAAVHPLGLHPLAALLLLAGLAAAERRSAKREGRTVWSSPLAMFMRGSLMIRRGADPA